MSRGKESHLRVPDLSADARCDEESGRVLLHIGALPNSGLVDRVFTGSKPGANFFTTDLLHQRHLAVGANDQLA